jgi:hypothetical protein
LQIKSKPGESMVFQDRQGGDIFLEVWLETKTLHVYRTVDTVLWPTDEEFHKYADKPYIWQAKAGMMRILSQIVMFQMDGVQNGDDAQRILEAAEMYIADYR